ncbi:MULTISPECIES: TolB family protein [unclassified Chryseobacterium]|uniref:TolB family protein n=1 Tax=unclassified Chryseobacterium TaxID=2593645 RepID=UPI00100C2D2C|nr:MULTISPECIES: PD40 domain-containing protein [unclassified Chryseobacterium]RXM50208.1 hypothetical protein BOQ64_19085 [Chryseobacterium sp. CH25]RXM62599.1 hypothetical protein BOQ60_21135 [Chryseobacterium sp. CH1]
MKGISGILFFLVTGLFSVQNTSEISLFNKDLNQFLNTRDLTLSKDGNEAYFTIQSPNQEISQIAFIKKNKGSWNEPQLASFNDSFSYMEPFLSSDGKRLYFASDRPLHRDQQQKKDFDIWYVERNTESSKWSEPVNMGKPVNSELNEFYPSLSHNNNLYFTMESPNGMGKDDIYFCKWDGKAYAAPQLLNENINSSGYEFNAYISPKENFIIYTKYNEKGGLGSGDLYISKKSSDGNWQKAENLGTNINTKFMEYCPFYDEKNKTLYFTSRRTNLPPRKFNGISDFQQYINEGENGLSKIYKISFDSK